MKKIFAMMAMAAISLSSFAFDYEPEEGLTWQGEIGLNVSSFNTKGAASVYDYLSAKPGLTIGGYGRYVLPGCAGVYGKFGVKYDMLGAKGSTEIAGVENEYTVKLHYINIPIHVGYMYGFTEDFFIHADVGPYFGLGVVGKNVDKVYVNDKLSATNTYSWYKDGNNDDDMKRLECGLGFNVGCEYLNTYIFNVGCDWGLVNQLKEPKWSKKDKLTNFNFHITLGYRL